MLRVDAPASLGGSWRVESGGVVSLFPDGGKPGLLVVRWLSRGSWRSVELAPADLAAIVAVREAVAVVKASISGGA